MKTVIFCLSFVCIMALPALAQTKTVTGYYCGSVTGNRAGDFAFRVGSHIATFHINFGQTSGNTNMTRFNVNALKVGNEFIITYGIEEAFITNLRATGKRNNNSLQNGMTSGAWLKFSRRLISRKNQKKVGRSGKLP